MKVAPLACPCLHDKSKKPRPGATEKIALYCRETGAPGHRKKRLPHLYGESADHERIFMATMIRWDENAMTCGDRLRQLFRPDDGDLPDAVALAQIARQVSVYDSRPERPVIGRTRDVRFIGDNRVHSEFPKLAELTEAMVQGGGRQLQHLP